MRQPTRQTRREFLKRLGALSSLGTAAPFALNLAGIGAASAQSADYKAIVCLFMFGGNDHFNMVMPYDVGPHGEYLAVRGGQDAGGIGYTRAQLGATSFNTLTPQAHGTQFAFCPSMSALSGLYAQGHAAVLANIGPLIAPTNRTQYRNNSVALPPKLFSHNDQQSVWQAYASEGVRTGWGGRMGDLLASQNGNTIFTAISASGNAVFLAGDSIFQYQISNSGATSIAALASRPYSIPSNTGTTSQDALRSIITDASSTSTLHLERDHVDVVKRSVNAAGLVTNALNAKPVSSTGIALPAASTNNRVAQQLQAVARLISPEARAFTGARRQVFFVSIGGFDTHDNEVMALQDDAAAGRQGLHGQVSRAIEYFYNATAAMGMQNNVTLFTASDFGRTLTSNGDGTDHGWGAHHFVVGGAVKGGDIYGTMPLTRLHTTTTANEQDSGSGRLIPTTSVDQLAATLATWFGVSNTDLVDVAPNIGNFNANLGFMI
ncbi:DUF1501 domain-containing protein [Uliginosibacterium sp. H1]|uniref:DUF1501 domain-containing protein n=1 Tax=Uliginosibacterium sp. H1 TaxID=3114757 RepID=UPI002E18A5B7|nr:DUF1501 domain-containing protein [Uliginosibacterium sp. H1]